MLIHIGKCGGSNITCKFRDFYSINIKHIHAQKPNKTAIKNADHICIMLRDPITRFISIFYYYYDLYLKYINKENIPHINIVKKTVKIFERFTTADMLANALNSKNKEDKFLANSAFKIFPHLVYNYEFYLSSKIIGLIIIKRLMKKVFIIRQEFYEEDFKIYHKFLILKYKIKKNKFNLFLENKRNNTNKFNKQKYLSENSLNNLKIKMKSDYMIFKKLVKYGLIDKSYVDSFK